MRTTGTQISVGMLAVATMLGATASAEAAKKLTPAKATALEQRLGKAGAGTYMHPSGNMVIAVTNRAAAGKVRRAGGIARIVRRSDTQLGRITRVLRAGARVAGTAWAVHPDANQVHLTIDSTVSDADRLRLRALVRPFGTAVRIVEAPPIMPLISGGNEITGGGKACSLGFNVTRGGVAHFLTAGHCTQTVGSWNVPGTTVGSSFPGNDFGIVRFTNSATPHPNNVTLYNGSFQTITTAADPVVGQTVSRSGRTTQVRSGRVTALDVTVNYSGSGTVTGLVATTACAQPGDSGGPVFAGSAALGLTSGAAGTCATNGTSLFQPVKEALSAYGAVLAAPPSGPTPPAPPPPPPATPPPAGPPATPAAPGTTLGSNQLLGSGASLGSATGYITRMQSDGNLVVIAPGNRPLWSSNTAGNPGAVAVMQPDGNLVVVAPGNRPVWSSRTAGNAGAIARIQDDGNFVVIARGNRPVWAAGTNGR